MDNAQVPASQIPLENTARPPSNPPSDSTPGKEGLSKRLIFIIAGAVGVIVILLIAFFAFTIISKQKNQKVTLRYWGLWEDSSIFQTVINDFSRKYPNITVIYQKRDPKIEGKYIDRINIRIRGGGTDAPDIVRYHNSWLPQLKNVLLPFSSDLVKKTGLETSYYPVVQRDLKKNGAYYGIPLMIDTLALFVNNKLFQAAGLQPPVTWNDVVNDAAVLTGKQSDDPNITIPTSGIALAGFDNIAHAPDILSALFIQNGADLLAPNGAKRANAIASLTFYTCLLQKSDGSCDKFWDPNGDDSRLAFAKGNLAMFFGYSWDIPLLKAANPNLDFSIYKFPKLQGQRNLTIASYWAEGISIRTKYPKEAELFLQYLSQKEVLAKLYTEAAKQRGFGELYPRTDMAQLLNGTQVEPFIAQAKDAVSTYYSSDTYDGESLTSALIAYMRNAVIGIISGNQSPDSAVDQWGNGISNAKIDLANGQ